MKTVRATTLLSVFVGVATLCFGQTTSPVTEYPLPTQNSSLGPITAGPDGALWFLETSGPFRVGRIATSGQLTEFPITLFGNASVPYGSSGITAGPDGNIWFCYSVLTNSSPGLAGIITQLSTSGQVLHSYQTVTPSQVGGIVAGSDGALWFTETGAGQIGRLTTAGQLTEYAIPAAGSQPAGITSGADGALWFTDAGSNTIGRVTTSHAFSSYPISNLLGGNPPTSITAGPDGALWFTAPPQQVQGSALIGRITTAGTFSSPFTIPVRYSDPEVITSGADGNLWFSDGNNNSVDCLSTTGTFTQYSVPTTASAPFGVIAGPDSAIWFTEEYGNRIGRLGVLSITTNSLPAGVTGMPYSASLTTQGGTSGAIWSVTTGLLPDGLSLNSTTGQITGTPTTAGAWTFTVEAAGVGSTVALPASRTLAIVVTGLPSFIEFPVNNSPGPITSGPDGGLWFTESGSQPGVARIDSTGAFTQYPVSQLTGSVTFGGIATGPDGNLWFTCWQNSASYIGRISVRGSLTLFPTPTYSSLQQITSGPDGALWFTEQSAGKIGQVTTSGSIAEYALPTAASAPFGITLGQDGALWFTETATAKLGRITTEGNVTEYPLSPQYAGSGPLTLGSIVSGPDGALWFTITNPSLIGRMTTAGVFSYYVAPQNSSPASITSGPDGSLWFTDSSGNQIDSITTEGTISQHTVPTSGSQPSFLTVGAGGELWFTELQGNKVGNLVIETTFREYPTLTANSNPGLITAGPDNALWFAEQGANLQIGRVSTAGAMSEYPVPSTSGGSVSGNQIGGISAGPDGNIWYTISNSLGSSFVLSLNTAGVTLSSYPIIVPSTLGAITAGPDGALWFTAGSANLIGRITPAGSTTTFPVPTSGSNPFGIALGPDQELWFTEQAGNKIGRITTSGSITEYALPASMQGPLSIVAGPGSNLYFALSNGQVGEITIGGTISSSSALAAASAFGIALGPDGNIWFTDPANNQIHQLGGSAYTILTASSLPYFLTLGPDGALWFTESSSSKVGRLGVPFLVSSSLPAGTTGAAYSVSLTTSGGTPPYSWSVINGSLPSGLLLNPTTGVISGTPNAGGSFNFNLLVTDMSQPQPISSDESRTIAIGTQVTAPIAPLTMTSNSIASAIAGQPYSFTLGAQGGTPPYSWTASGLPAGFSLSASGTLSGTTSQTGSYSLSIQVTDSGSPLQTTAQTFSLVIGAQGTTPTLTIAAASAPNGTAGAPYSTTLAAQGGTPPYVWTATGLPSGLALSTAGVLSGTPANSGSYTISIQVADSSSPALVATQSYALTIVAASSSSPAAISITGLPNTEQGEQAISAGLQLSQAYSSDISGTSALSFTPSAADLPTPYSNPGVCFTTVSSCGTNPQMTSTFTIPAGSTVLTLPQIQTGTVAGTISLTVTPSNLPATTGTIDIPAAVPVIEANSVQITNVTSTGFVLELVADSTTRDMQSATFSFNAASGTDLTGPTTFTVQLASLLSQWYSSSEGQGYGSLFSLSVPFTLSGSSSAIGSVTATLTNSVGTSAPITGTR